MPHGKRLASFCRLCLIKTQTKVAIFGGQEEANLLNLLKLIELEIDREAEPEAVLCYDCIVTLEGFFQFKEQCHANDEFLQTLPPKDSAEGSEVSEGEDEDVEGDDNDFLQEEDDARIVDSEEEGRVEEIDLSEEEPTLAPSAKRLKRESSEETLQDVRQSGRVRKPTAKALASPVKKNISKKSSPVKPVPVAQKRKRQKSKPLKIREPRANELQPLKESYPDYFHFEKSPRSLYFTLVYYGERFNSAIYGGTQTYWQCAYKRKFHCPAVVHVANDYGRFERRFEHTHDEQRETASELELFTPRQALPAVFRICWQKLMEKKARQQEVLRVKKELRLNGKTHEKQEEEVFEKEDNIVATDEEDEVEDDGAYSLIKMLESDPEDDED
uniref:ZAD domain-containing protein n=1 Tax=Culex tarsalis TaxID=7177 RepID=A0A1Q3F2M8_CULTA